MTGVVMEEDRQRQWWLDAHHARASITRRLEARFGSSAEDVVATAVERAGQRQFRDDAQAAALTAHIAEKLGIDVWRRERTAAKYAPQLVDVNYAPSPEDLYLDQELRSRVAQAVQALPPDRRDALVALADDVPVTEIAERLGRSVYAVKHLVARAREQVRAQLRDAELTLVAWWARRKRAADDIATSPALATVGSAMVIALTVAAPVAGQLLSYTFSAYDSPVREVAFAAFETDPVDNVANVANRNGAGGPLARPAVPSEAGLLDGAVDDAGQTYYRTVAKPALDAIPSSIEAKADGHDVNVHSHEADSPRAAATHDDGDAVEDTLDCLVDQVWTPWRFGCPPSDR
jgi:RNA polymerase sigma factor (sigma-70 family)